MSKTRDAVRAAFPRATMQTVGVYGFSPRQFVVWDRHYLAAGAERLGSGESPGEAWKAAAATVVARVGK